MRTDTQSRAFLLLLVALSGLGPFTLNVLLPSLPSLPVALATTREKAQLVLSLYLFGMALSQLVLGPMADRFGRRPVILAALTLYVGASLAATFAPNVEVLVTARVIQSFGATAGLTLARTMIRDIFETNAAARIMGIVTAAMVLAPMLAPVIGATIDDQLGWRAILGFCTLLGAVSLLIAWPNLPETRPATLVAASTREVAQRTLNLIGNPVYMTYWVTSAFASAMFFGFLGAAPHLVIEVMGFGKSVYAFAFMSLSIGYMAGNFATSGYVRKYGIGPLILIGTVAGLLGALAMFLPAVFGQMSLWSLFPPMILIAFGNGLVIANSMAGGIGADPKAAGAGSGFMGFGQVGVGAIVSYVAGKASDASALPLASMMLACALIALVSGWRVAREAPRPHSS